MKQRTLGDGVTVSALGLGAMGMSDFYGAADRAASLATVHQALEAGITYIDTGDFYGSGHNELLLAEALRDHRREDVFLAVKFGGLRDPDGGFLGIDTRPVAMKNFLAMTLQRLGTDYVDLYQPARLDSQVPIEDTVGAIAEEIEAGHVRHLGLSEVGVDTLRRAQAVHPVAALQIEYALLTRGIEDDILPACRELGIGITAYGVLSRGLLSGQWTAERSERPADWRSHLPRFSGDNLEHNLALVEKVREVADGLGVSVATLATAWVMAQSEEAGGGAIVPLAGARKPSQLDDALAAAELELDRETLARLEAAVPRGAVAGERYAREQMAMLDSER